MLVNCNTFGHGKKSTALGSRHCLRYRTTSVQSIRNIYISMFTTLTASMASQYLAYACGIAFCIGCSGLTALGLVTQKSVLNVANGTAYTEPRWLAGLILIIVGQLLNLPAVAFVPQTVVSVLGSLTIVFSSILGRVVLKEQLSRDHVLVMLALMVGATLVVLEMPVEEEVLYVDHIFGAKNQPFISTALMVLVGLGSLGALSAIFASLQLFFFGLTSAACGSYAITFFKCCAQIVSSDRWWQNSQVYILSLMALGIFILQIACTQTMLRCYDAVILIPVFFGLGIVFTIFQAQWSFHELSQLHGEARLLLMAGLILVIGSTVVLRMLQNHGTKEERLPLTKSTTEQRWFDHL